MTVFISLWVVCGFAVLQCYGDKGVTVQVNDSNESSDESRMKSSRPPAPPSNMQAQYEIVRLCTSIPATYDDIMNMYLSTGKTIKPSDLQIRMADLKSQSSQLSEFVNAAYATTTLNEQELDPVRKELLSKNGELIQALEKLQASSASEPKLDTAKKVSFVMSDIRPPLLDFQTACLAETKDIVNNMLADLRDNSNNMID